MLAFALRCTMGVLVCVAASSCAWAIELRDLPPSVRDALQPVDIRYAEESLSEGGPRASAYPVTVPTGSIAAGLAPMRTEGLVLLLTLRTLLGQGRLLEADVPRWLSDHQVGSGCLIEALNAIPLTHPMDPIYIPICAACWEQCGASVQRVLGYPYRGRITMGIYLGLLGREEDGRALLASVPEEWQKLDPTVPMYHVANELVRVRKTAPRLGIWAWKWGASMRRPADRAFICNHILCACLRLPEEERPDAIRLEVIPWVESALAEPESEGLGWDNTLPDLILAYGLTDDAEKATERGAFWLREAARRGISADDLPRTRLRLAQMLECVGRQAEAAVMLRDLADHPSQRAREDARTALGALIERHPEVQRQ